MSLKGGHSNGEFSDDMKEHVRPAPPSAPASDYAPRSDFDLANYDLMPKRRPHVVLVEREPGKPYLRIGDEEPTRYADAVNPAPKKGDR